MHEPGCNPDEVVGPVENRTLLPHVVETGVVLFQLLSISKVVNILLEYGFEEERQCCKNHIIVRDIEIIKDGLS